MEDGQERDGDVDDAAKLDALGRVLGAGALGVDSNGARILSYLVHEAIDGRGERIKGVTVAQDALGRGAAFDPSKDSAVRVEMKRLREALDHHYATAGADDPVRIRIPKGRYAPTFRACRAGACSEPGFADMPADAQPMPPGRRSRFRRPVLRGLALVLLPVVVFVVSGAGVVSWMAAARPDPGAGNPSLRIVATDAVQAGLFEEYLVARDTLTMFRNVDLVTDGTHGPDYLLRLSPIIVDGHPRIDASLLRAVSGDIVSSRSFAIDEVGRQAKPNEPTAFRAWLGRIASFEGQIFHDHAARDAGAGDFVCSVLVHGYFLHQTDERHLAARDCLDRRAQAGAKSARHFIGRTAIAREEFTDRRNHLPGDPLDRALRAARRAVAADNFNATAHYMLMTVLVLLDAEVAAKQAGETAMRLAPYDGTIAGGFGARLIVMGEYDRALSLLHRARDLAPGSEPWRDFNQFLAYFGRGDIGSAASTAMALHGTENPLYLAAVAIAHAVRGDASAAAEAKMALLAREPDPRDMFERRRYRPALVERLVDSLNAIDTV